MPRDVNLDLDLVRTFVTVAETGSFTRTGERLGRTQSAISLQVRRLEESLGSRLLVRDPRRVGLTEAGEAFLPKARRLLRIDRWGERRRRQSGKRASREAHHRRSSTRRSSCQRCSRVKRTSCTSVTGKGWRLPRPSARMRSGA